MNEYVPNSTSENDRAYFTVSGRDRYVEERGAQDSHGRGELDDEATRGRDLGEILADCFDHASTEHPQAHRDAHAAVEQDPLGRGRRRLDAIVLIDEVETDDRADGVRDVVAAVRERAEHGREHLQEREELGGCGRIGMSVQVDLFDVLLLFFRRQI